MRQKWIFIMVSGVLAATLTTAGTSFGKSEESEVRGGSIKLQTQTEANFPSMAKIMPEQAVQAALAAVPGKLLKAGLEDENGFLVYGIEVVTADRAIMEVKVDAGSGKILAMNRDKADDGGNESGKLEPDRDSEE